MYTPINILYSLFFNNLAHDKKDTQKNDNKINVSFNFFIPRNKGWNKARIA